MSATNEAIANAYWPTDKEKRDLHTALQYVATQPFDDLVQKEAQMLAHIFNAASAVLSPYAKDELEAQCVSAQGLSHIYRNSASAYQSVMLNYPLIVRDGAIEAIIPRHPNPGRIYGLERDNGLFGTYFEPGVEPKQRMFNTGRFGFIPLRFGHRGNNPFVKVVPYVSLPAEFVDTVHRTDSWNLIHSFERMTALINHDWLHSILIGSINTAISEVSYHSPAFAHLSRLSEKKRSVKPGDNRIASLFTMRNLRDMERLIPKRPYFTLKPVGKSDPYEEWAMRLQREVLTHMASQPDNPLERAVNDYLREWFKLTLKKPSHEVMEEIPQSPVDFAMKLLAYNLVRAVPQDHPLVQKAIKADKTGRAAEIFKKLYASRLARRTLFGNGPAYHDHFEDGARRHKTSICGSPDEYGAVVLNATTNAVRFAYEDSRDALFLAGMNPDDRLKIKQSGVRFQAPQTLSAS